MVARVRKADPGARSGPQGGLLAWYPGVLCGGTTVLCWIRYVGNAEMRGYAPGARLDGDGWDSS